MNVDDQNNLVHSWFTNFVPNMLWFCENAWSKKNYTNSQERSLSSPCNVVAFGNILHTADCTASIHNFAQSSVMRSHKYCFVKYCRRRGSPNTVVSSFFPRQMIHHQVRIQHFVLYLTLSSKQTKCVKHNCNEHQNFLYLKAFENNFDNCVNWRPRKCTMIAVRSIGETDHSSIPTRTNIEIPCLIVYVVCGSYSEQIHDVTHIFLNWYQLMWCADGCVVCTCCCHCICVFNFIFTTKRCSYAIISLSRRHWVPRWVAASKQYNINKRGNCSIYIYIYSSYGF